jgi:hypothetical protein
MRIEWICCQTYDEAKKHSRVIYLHERDGKPFYWGKAGDCSFGVRYNSGYRHWVEGCLRYGAKLYIGQPDDETRCRVGEIENYLIHRYPSAMNTKGTQPLKTLSIDHSGDVPAFIPRADR